jgi:predicted DNA-binding transcriptional regulator YafY
MNGLRWHIRCFNHAKGKFRDFNLTRFQAVAESGPSEKSIDQDSEWTKEVAVILGPHPKAEHPETIRFDYDMEGNTKIVAMSLCGCRTSYGIGTSTRHRPARKARKNINYFF